MISVDNVYKTVQRILNKEQRGYLPPNEFNFFADLANTEVFENYFYELSQYNNVPMAMTEDDDYADIKKLLAEKIHVFESETSEFGSGHVDFSSIENFYRLGTVFSGLYELDEVTRREFRDISRSPLTSTNSSNGVWIRERNGITLSTNAAISYIRKPASPVWGYIAVNNKPVYNINNSTDFELHTSDLPDIVVKIAGYAGVAIKAADVAQAASAKEQMLDNQEKQ